MKKFFKKSLAIMTIAGIMASMTNIAGMTASAAATLDPIEINETNFPDKGLRDLLNAKDTNHNGTLDSNELNFTSLGFNNIEVNDLTGLNLLKNLKNLTFRETTGLKAIDSSDFPEGLLGIEMSYCYDLASVNIADYNGFDNGSISISDTNKKLSSVNISGCKGGIGRLGISGDNIKKVTVKDNIFKQGFESLGLTSYGKADYVIGANENLTNIHFYGIISSIDATECTTLKKIYVDNYTGYLDKSKIRIPDGFSTEYGSEKYSGITFKSYVGSEIDTLDCSTIDNFDLSKVISWYNGSCSNGIITPYDNGYSSKYATCYYDIGNGKKASWSFEFSDRDFGIYDEEFVCSAGSTIKAKIKGEAGMRRLIVTVGSLPRSVYFCDWKNNLDSNGCPDGTHIDYFTMDENGVPNNIKWVIESEPAEGFTANKASAAAKFRNDISFNKALTDYKAAVAAAGSDETKLDKAKANKIKAEKNSYKEAALASNDKNLSKKSTNIANIGIGNLKSNGQFNNVVVVKAVTLNYTAEPVKEGKKIIGYNEGSTDDKPSWVYASFKLYINPEKPSEWKAIKADENGIIAKKTVSRTDPTILSQLQLNEDNTYTLTLMEGQSYKLPFAVTNGADKTLSYKADVKYGSFTVLNGTVKALMADTYAIIQEKDSGTIDVIPNGDPSKAIKVKVIVKPVNAVKALRSSTATLAMPGSVNGVGMKQFITVSPKTATGGSVDYKIKFEKSADDYTVEYFANSGAAIQDTVSFTGNVSDAIEAENGVIRLSVQLKSGKQVTSGEKITVYTDGNEKVKTAIALKAATAPEPVKNFKETVKLNKVTGYRELALPKGSVYNLGISVNPAAADSSWEWKYISGEYTAPLYFANTDVIIADIVGTGYYQAVSTAKDINGNKIKSEIYKITVYEPASSIIFDAPSMTVRGGYLIEAGEAEYYSNKNLTGGKWYRFTRPSAAENNEPIVWTSSKPANCIVLDDGKNLSIKASAAGTYTVTGVSQYTKQKYSFKAMFVENSGTPANEVIDVIEEEGICNSDTYGGASRIKHYDELEMAVGKKTQLMPLVTGVCGKAIKYEIVGDNAAAAKKCISLSAAGVLSVKKHFVKADGTPDTAIIKVTLTDGAKSPTILSTSTVSLTTVPAKVSPSLTVGKKKFAYTQTNDGSVIFNVTGIEDPQFYIRDGSGYKYMKLTVEEQKNAKNVVTGYKWTANIDESPIFDYKVFVAPGSACFNENQLATLSPDLAEYENNEACCVKLYVTEGKSLTKPLVIVDPKTVYTEDDEKDVYGYDLKLIQKNRTGTNTTNGIEVGKSFKLPIALNTKEAADVNKEWCDIEWTSSNPYLITCVDNDSWKMDENDHVIYFNESKFKVNDEGYTGKVTLTGTARNSGKQIKLTVYVVAPSA